MNEYTRKKIITIAGIILLVICLGMVVIGQKTVSYPSLGIMLAGLGGILLLLYLYNRAYNRK